jgi:hypothetical protein
MVKEGEIKLRTGNENITLPIFSEGDSGSQVSEVLRVETESGTGFLPLTDTGSASFPFLRVKTGDGVKAVHNSATLRFEDFFDDGSLDTGKWFTIGTSYGTISESDGTLFIENSSGGDDDAIGIVSEDKVISVGEKAVARSRNPSGRHSTLLAIGSDTGSSDGSKGYFYPYPHSAGGPGVSYYGRADNDTSTFSKHDENGDKAYSSYESGHHGQSDFIEVEIHRPDDSTVEIYIDRNLEHTWNGTFTEDYHVYFSTDGYDKPSRIYVDYVYVEDI